MIGGRPHIAAVDARGAIEAESSRAIVPWWSFTKPLIAACVLRLAEQGRIALDAPLAGRPYTPRHLLQHRAGLGDYGGLPAYHAAVVRGDTPWSYDELLARMPADELLFPPGQGWAYSNIGYLLLRRLVERTCSAGLNEALRALVLDPLGLPVARLAETSDDMAGTALPCARYDPGWVFHGVVIGPVAEAALGLHRLLQSTLLEPASRAAMLECHLIGGPLAGRPWRTTGYGLGLMIGTMQCAGMRQPLAVIGHSAGGPGSVGAVYHARHGGERTAAAFLAAADDGAAENEALRLLADRQVRSGGLSDRAPGPCRRQSLEHGAARTAPPRQSER